MKPDDLCPGDEALALFASGALGEAEREDLLAHIEGCEDCRARWGAMEAPPGPAAPHPLDREALLAAAGFPPRARTLPLKRGALAAAASLLLVPALAWLWRKETSSRSLEDRPAPPSAARRLEPSADRIHVALEEEPFGLSDGSRLIAWKGARFRCLPPERGDRALIELQEGTLEAEVTARPGLFRIVAEAGEIRVVGTRFVARAARIRPFEAEKGAASLLSVEVTEGKVRLQGKGGDALVSAGKRGILVGEASAPLLQEFERIDWREAARRWGREWGSEGFAGTFPCATLLAGTWAGIRGWEEALDEPAASAEERRVAAALSALQAGPEDRRALLSRARAERDAEVLRLLLKGAAKTLPEGAAAWIGRIEEAGQTGPLRRIATEMEKAEEER